MIRIHFLNVGHGDCIIVEFKDSGRVAVIDINMTEDMDETSYAELLDEAISLLDDVDRAYHSLRGYSNEELLVKAEYKIELQNPINYLTENHINGVFRFISTHPHMDHMTGLKELNEAKGMKVLWISKNNQTQEESKLSDTQKEDWKFYKKHRDTKQKDLDGIRTIGPKSAESNNFWREDKITILAPDTNLLSNSNTNNLSYVLLIEYGGKKIVLGGDAEKDSWDYILENYSNLIKDVTILKASHHGRDSGYHQKAVKQMNPEFTIVSVGKKPSTDASNKYRNYCDNVWSTRWKGNIVFEIQSNGEMTFDTQHDR
ncbi:ComEC/Rec2 family competence protein [Carboxylicivirga sp. M1479]|uniref:ComEC/Rec2 family competence protein n=1 Tax=Carboxylicivirga sp. M1479 TaxID=2594476 RepID=UPI001178AED0|nr:MBL fold metallo-hydrolase [Carboxylicivirga sp. M1479]TRX66404.1 hypothetical protein FNN09_13640 [Carboxylicivirga sp. M1479]